MATSYCRASIRKAMDQLELDIKALKSVAPGNSKQFLHKQQKLNFFLQEKVKGNMVLAPFTTLRHIGAPTTFFFSWRGLSGGNLT